ncbi:DUF305 domain-containing protein [uncultured Paludibaculum sp.]|uniref:CopM family metallochaperone n=1 Tax=uncultured Paludibaculum sp. TaxID=1765020 RepID=UPI002AABA8CC|nr:DUF305 domain-containing protein [uncultured Paludibaculum sp.]
MMKSLPGGGSSLGFRLLVCLGAAGILTAAIAQTTHSGFMAAMHESMARMDAQMEAAPMSGNPDRDFASMMIPHHQGAIDMAKAELIHGKDPTMRRLAQEIVIEQQSEIEAMTLRLKKLNAGSAKGDR